MTIELPRAVADDWRRLGTRTNEGRLSLVSVSAEILVYEHASTADALADLGDAEIPIRSLFTVETSFDPPLSTVGIDPAEALERAAPKARSQFVDVLEDEGIAIGEERANERVERADGTEGRLTVFAAEYPLDRAGNEGERTTLDAEAHVAVWPTAEDFVVVGGLLPLESPPEIEAAVLDVDPERDRRLIIEAIRSVPLGEDGSRDDGDPDDGDRDGETGRTRQ